MRQVGWRLPSATVVALGPVLRVASASAQSVQTDFDRAFDFSKLKTIAFTPQQRGPDDPLTRNPINERRIRSALDSQLVAHGYTEDSSGKPDFLVAYYAAARQRVSLRERAYGPGRWAGGQIDVD